jgi:hypothetical protein
VYLAEHTRRVGIGRKQGVPALFERLFYKFGSQRFFKTVDTGAPEELVLRGVQVVQGVVKADHGQANEFSEAA